MGFEGFRTGDTVERRIGRRSSHSGLEVTWVVPRTGFTLRGTPRQHPGPVENISFTGAAILGPASMPLEVDAQVLVRYQGYDSSVIVRRREPTDDPALHRFGVELAVVHPFLRDEIRDHLAVPEQPSSAFGLTPRGAVAHRR